MKLIRRFALLLIVMTFAATMMGQSVTIQSGQTVTALNAVTVTGNSSTYQVKLAPGLQLPGNYSWSIVATGAPVSVSVTLQGSLDGGATWYTLDTSTITTSEMRFVTGKPVPFLRVSLGTLSGGTAPTVTVVLMASK